MHWPYDDVELHYYFFFNCGVVSYQRIAQDVPACTCSVHHQHQMSRIQRKLFGSPSLPDQPEACCVLLSGGVSCPIRAKTHHSDFRNRVCSHPSHGRNLPSRPVSFGRQSTPHRLLFGHSILERFQYCQGRWYKHRCFEHQLHTAQHSFCRLKNNEFWSIFITMCLPLVERFHMTSRWPGWRFKQILRELNSFLTISFVFINLHIWWPRDRKRSIGMPPPKKI